MAEKLQSIVFREAQKALARRDFPPKSKMNTRIVIYVPSTRSQSQNIKQKDFDERVNEVKEFVTRKLGGTTTVMGYGTYTSQSGQTVGENVAKVLAFVNYDEWKKHDQDFEKWLEHKKIEWGQESIAFEFESPEDHASILHFV